MTLGNQFLTGALRSLPGASLEIMAPGGESGITEDRVFDLGIWDASPPPQSAPARAFLCFGTVPPGRDIRVEGALDTPLLGDGDWNDSHPVNRYADYSGLYVRKAMRVVLPEGATVLLESRDGPLAAAFEDKGPRSVAVFFDIRDSDWPFQVSFPVFLTNAVNWLCAGGESGAEGEWHRVGEPVRLRASGTVEVKGPDGKITRASPDGDAPPVFGGAGGTGVYEGTDENGVKLRFAVNLLSPAESNVKPRRNLELQGETVEAAPAARTIHREYWPWLALAAIALLLVEWWVYHRRAV